jgi:polysaccharide export outer membrane protein
MMQRGRKIAALFVAVLVLDSCLWASERTENAIAPQERPSTVSVVPGPDYLIGPGDVLEISVWEAEDLTRTVAVLPDGTISFPLVGGVKAAERRLTDLEKEVEEKVARFVPDPVVYVEVRQVNSMLIYVIGRVKNPGRFPLNANVNVMQALAMAGGLNPFAERDEIKIFRDTGGETEIFRFTYDAVSHGENLEENITLKRGDVIVVP